MMRNIRILLIAIQLILVFLIIISNAEGVNDHQQNNSNNHQQNGHNFPLQLNGNNHKNNHNNSNDNKLKLVRNQETTAIQQHDSQRTENAIEKSSTTGKMNWSLTSIWKWLSESPVSSESSPVSTGAESRTFGRFRKIQMALIPLVFKFGVMSTLIMVLVALSLKSILLLKALIILNIAGILAKFIAHKIEPAPTGNAAQTTSWGPPAPPYPWGPHGAPGWGGSHAHGGTGWNYGGGHGWYGGSGPGTWGRSYDLAQNHNRLEGGADIGKVTKKEVHVHIHKHQDQDHQNHIAGSNSQDGNIKQSIEWRYHPYVSNYAATGNYQEPEQEQPFLSGLEGFKTNYLDYADPRGDVYPEFKKIQI